MKTDDNILVAALRILVEDVYCEDGIATGTMAEAANRLEELIEENKNLKHYLDNANKCVDLAIDMLEKGV